MRRSANPTTEAEASALLFRKLAAIVATNKRPSKPIAWVRDGRNLRFTVTLDVDGVTQEGIAFFDRASSELPNRNVTLGLSCYIAEQQGNFDRMDWRPLSAHKNKSLGPVETRFLIIEGTHHHTLADNAALTMGLLRAIVEKLPVALPVEPEPDWPAFLALAGQRWNIERLIHIPVPPWDLPLALSGRPDTI